MNKRKQQAIIWSIGMFVTAVMLGLGIWQAEAFSNSGRDALVARMQEPPVNLLDVAPAGREPGDSYGRAVTATGTYLAEQQLLIPVPGDESRARVLTALELPDGSVVPVVRGVASGTPNPPPPGQVTVTGIFLPSEGEPERELPEGQLGTIRMPRIAQMWDQALVPGFIVQDEAGAQAQDMPAAHVQLPSNAGHARNQGYALQWWIFAFAAVAATVKLSRDAATGTGFMRSSVDDSGDTVDKSGLLSTADGSETENWPVTPATTVEKSSGTAEGPARTAGTD
ncbi:SURF1 family protein [Ammonicoccus fulvus]|uniref:SURF1-like protein n=1 Tax=Ammonicoccus fulvus TaxID=3138240 RepID=A0ABZ3FTE4_9ACTN